MVISDITHILRFEKKKLKYNFQQQLTASLAHEQLTPLNSIVNVTQILQTGVYEDIVSRKYEELNKKPKTKTLMARQRHIMLQTILEDQKRIYEHSRIIWSSA